MSAVPNGPRALAHRIFSALGIGGLIIAVAGVLLDLVPGASPGFSAPQLLLIAGGLAVALFGFALRVRQRRERVSRWLKANMLKACLVALATLVLLELALSLAGQATWFPLDVPETFLEPVDWWICDDAGCHFVYDEMATFCEATQIGGRFCLLNRQGFHDTQDFVASADLEERFRVLVLGDSFALGRVADIGTSFVEVLEQALPEAVIWNTGIPGSGTNQALQSNASFAPILKPHLTILGFYMNDFDDNLVPIDGHFLGVSPDYGVVFVRQYQIDSSGNARKLTRQSDLYYRFRGVDPPVNDLHRLLGNTRLGSLAIMAADAARQMFMNADGARHRRSVDVTRGYLADLRDQVEASGAAFLVLVIPRHEDLSKPSARYRSALLMLDELGVAYIDIARQLQAQADYAIPHDTHWSNSGHQKAGIALLRCLEAFQSSGDLEGCRS